MLQTRERPAAGGADGLRGLISDLEAARRAGDDEHRRGAVRRLLDYRPASWAEYVDKARAYAASERLRIGDDRVDDVVGDEQIFARDARRLFNRNEFTLRQLVSALAELDCGVSVGGQPCFATPLGLHSSVADILFVMPPGIGSALLEEGARVQAEHEGFDAGAWLEQLRAAGGSVGVDPFDGRDVWLAPVGRFGDREAVAAAFAAMTAEKWRRVRLHLWRAEQPRDET